MTKISSISLLSAVTIIAAVSLPIVCSQRKTTPEFYNKFIPANYPQRGHFNPYVRRFEDGERVTPIHGNYRRVPSIRYNIPSGTVRRPIIRTTHAMADLTQNTRGAPIEFPENPTQTVRIPGNTTPSCIEKGKDFCINVNDYPSDVLEGILNSTQGQYLKVLGNDKPNFEIVPKGDIGEEEMCECVQKIIQPKLGLSIKDEYEYIVNTGNFTQGVLIEECRTPSGPCNKLNSVRNGYKAECKQKYVYRSLLGYSKEKRIEKILFKFPSCCQCVIKKIE